MQQISKVTKDLNIFADALQGKWDRHSSSESLWVICGRVVFLEGKYTDFIYDSKLSDRTGKRLGIVAWHHFGGDTADKCTFHIGILGDETQFQDTTGGGEGGVTEVFHDDTLTGKGTEDDPLSVVSQGLTVVEHNDTLTGDGTSESKLSVNTDQIPTKTYVDNQDAQVAADAAEWVEEEAGARATADTALQTQIDYDRETYGILSKYEATNTLHFYRPKSVPIPDYYLPETHFDGTEGQVIHTGYALLTEDPRREYLSQWTLFVNVIWNNCDTNTKFLMDFTGLGTHSNYNQSVNSGCVYTQDIEGQRKVAVYWTKYDPDWYHYYVYFDPEEAGHTIPTYGKMALRRSSYDGKIKYTLNGIDWLDTDIELSTNSGSATRYELCFGGYADETHLGVGTITARLWKQPLEDISKLF